jgi:hypothetical protein
MNQHLCVTKSDSRNTGQYTAPSLCVFTYFILRVVYLRLLSIIALFVVEFQDDGVC